MSIHPSAIVSNDAEIGNHVTIGPFAVIEAGTTVGDFCRVEAAAQVRSGTTLGPGCFVGSGAIIGGDPQVRGFDHRIASGVQAGSGNVFREYVTVHRSMAEGGQTRLGDGNFLMAQSHVGHDAEIGDETTLANNVMIGGHARIGNRCFLGGGSGIHQFVRIGDLVVTQGNSGFSMDVPPYLIGAKINEIAGINAVGLKRAGFTLVQRTSIKEAFRRVYRSPDTLKEILESIDETSMEPQVFGFYKFLRENSKKGLCIRGAGII